MPIMRLNHPVKPNVEAKMQPNQNANENTNMEPNEQPNMDPNVQSSVAVNVEDMLKRIVPSCTNVPCFEVGEISKVFNFDITPQTKEQVKTSMPIMRLNHPVKPNVEAKMQPNQNANENTNMEPNEQPNMDPNVQSSVAVNVEDMLKRIVPSCTNVPCFEVGEISKHLEELFKYFHFGLLWMALGVASTIDLGSGSVNGNILSPFRSISKAIEIYQTSFNSSIRI
ncbi:hypothetical protein DEO72_LG1g3137 [Vigna unguiculata]|uniref:Uncharacterized protein n=1 Tax=Vigna unguiculata TaxID=3917 RepID=A0A4D6KSH0_VIGUN|nr:hypothetical protein DEO72_LG1g3137 [Vigna unguiculata]